MTLHSLISMLCREVDCAAQLLTTLRILEIVQPSA